MGRRIVQRIYDCDLCGETPDHGEPMWEMGLQVWCESCADNDCPEERAEQDIEQEEVK